MLPATMGEPFRAFTFVDRILSVQPGTRIQGQYAIPSGLKEFPSSLVAEAVGQLAAWSAMAAIDFKFRPVAGLAAQIDLLAEPKPGALLELSAEIESVDTEAVSYGGVATCEGVPLLRLHHSVGPMVPMQDFDDPAAVAKRFEILCAGSRPLGGFEAVPGIPLERREGEAGRVARAAFVVPGEADFFADHFPRKPVFPGTLLMHTKLQVVAMLANELPVPAGKRWAIRRIADVKLRAFIPPGEALEVESRLDSISEGSARILVEGRKGKRTLGGAKVWLEAESA